MPSGIYQIRNINDNKIYIGSSINLDKRKRSHFALLRNNKHCNSKLQNSFNKHGETCFCFEVLTVCDSKDLIKYEQEFINSLHPEYNICKVAGNTLGIKFSDATKKKLSEIRSKDKHPNFGKKLSEQTKNKISESKIGKSSGRKGIKFSEESRKKLSAARRNRVISEEQKQKTRETFRRKREERNKENG